MRIWSLALVTAWVTVCRADVCQPSLAGRVRVVVEPTGLSLQEQRARVALGERDDPCDLRDFRISGTERRGSGEAAQRS